MSLQDLTVPIVVAEIPQTDEEDAEAEWRANRGFWAFDVKNCPGANRLYYLAQLSEEEREEEFKRERAEERRRAAQTHLAYSNEERRRPLLYSLREYAQQVTMPQMPEGLDRSGESRWLSKMFRLRENALRQIGAALARGEPIRSSDIKCLNPRDIELIRAEGDPYLRRVVAEYEQAQVRQQDRGRDFGR